MIVNIILGCIILLIIISMFLARRNIDESLLSVRSTDSLKGISIIMIVLAHICQFNQLLKYSLIGGEHTYKFVFSWGAIGVSLFFFLSGYGCYSSVIKKKRLINWLTNHILKMLLHFAVAFILVVSISILLFGRTTTTSEIFTCFFEARMPGSTTWYLKIQILFYIFITISMIISKKSKYSTAIIVALSIVYALLSSLLFKQADYWWKTSLCFSAGCFAAQYKRIVKNYLEKWYCKLAVFFLGGTAYFAIILDAHYRIVLQLSAYIFIALSISLFWDCYIKGNGVFEKVGKITLDIYLVHIGLLEAVFSHQSNANYRILIYIGVVAILSIINHYISEKLFNGIKRFFLL